LFVLDVDDLREVVNDIGSKISNPDEQFEKINYILERNYCIQLPRGLKYASTEKFGDVVSSPLVYERAINAILKRRILKGETKVIIKNPRALYRIGILGYDETIRLDLTVEGNVGNFFAASCNFDGVWIVKGNAENGLADKGYKGTIVVEGFATELAGQNNQATEFSNGVDILVRKGCMERAMGQARGGSLVTFGAGYNSGLYMSGGTLLNLDRPGKSFGPGMVGGTIYSPEGTTAGEGAKAVKLTRSDYTNIVQTLRKFKNELDIHGLERLSPENPKILLTSTINSVDTYDLRDFIKIVPKDK